MNRTARYERDATLSRWARLAGNYALLFAIGSLAPALVYLFSALFVTVFSYFIFLLVNIILVMLSLGFILFAGFPVISYDEITGGESPAGVLGEWSFLPVYLAVTAAAACALGAVAVLLGRKTRGIDGSGGAAGRGIAAIVISAIAGVLTLTAVLLGGSV